jgi:hypothetical protein
MATPILGSAAMAAVPTQRAGMAAGALNTVRQLGYALGIAVLGSVFAARTAQVLSDHGVPDPNGVAKAVAGGQTPRLLAEAPASVNGALDSALHAASIAGVQWAFFAAGAVGVLAGATTLVLMRRRPAGDVADDKAASTSSASAEPAAAV